MAIDASIPLQSFQPVDIAGAYHRGQQMRMARDKHKWEQEDRERENNRRRTLADFILQGGQVPDGVGRTARTVGGIDAPPPAEAAHGQTGRLADLLPGANPRGGIGEAGAMPSRRSEAVMGFPSVEMGGGADPRAQGNGRPATVGQLAQQGQAMAQQQGGQELPNVDQMRQGAWEALVRTDPDGALKIRRQQFDNMKEEIELVGTLASGVTDQASYEDALRRAGGYGLDVSQLPREYQPELIQAYRMQAAGAAQALMSIARDKRLQWDVEDDRLDNERADMALGARVDYQEERLEDADNAEAGRNARASKPRPSAAPKTPQSEGALYADIRRRFNKGEEITDRERAFGREYEARQRAKAAPRGGKGGGAGNRASGYGDGAIIKNPRTGQRMRLEGGKWVPVK